MSLKLVISNAAPRKFYPSLLTPEQWRAAAQRWRGEGADRLADQAEILARVGEQRRAALVFEGQPKS